MMGDNIAKKLLLRQLGQGNIKTTHFFNNCTHLNMTYYLREDSSFSDDKVRTINLDSNGRYLLVGTARGSLSIYDTRHFEFKDDSMLSDIRRIRGTNSPACSIETLLWFPNHEGMFLSGGHDQKITIWDANAIQPVETYNFSKNISQAAVPRAGGAVEGLIAVASAGQNVKLIDLKSGLHIHELQGLSGGAVCCAWSPITDYMLVVGGLESIAKVWDVRSGGRPLAGLYVNDGPTKSLVNGVIFTPDGTRLITACKSRIASWNIAHFKNTNIDYARIMNTRPTPINFQVAVYGSHEVCFIPTFNSVNVLNIKTGQTLSDLTGHYGFCNCVDYSTRTMNLYSGGDDGNIIVWSSERPPNEASYNFW